LFQLSDTPTSAVKFFYLHETRESSCSVRSITDGGCSTRGVSESWKQSSNEKELAIVHRWVIDRELLDSEFRSGCPLRHKLFDCEFIIALSQKLTQACTPVHKSKTRVFLGLKLPTVWLVAFAAIIRYNPLYNI